MMNFSYVAVIVTYNRKKKLIKAINSLLKQTLLPKKIVLIDNNSNDGTNELLKEVYPNQLGGVLSYHCLSENIGGSGGFHIGVKEALKYDSNYIALSDDDVVYRPDYFERIKKAAIYNKDIKAFQGVAYDDIQDKYLTQGRKIIDWNTLNSSSISNPTENIYFDLATFVGFTFEVTLVKKIGLPINNFFIWNDDAEYSLRMSKLTKILQVKDAVVEHCGTQRTSSLVPLWKTYYGFRNRFVLRKKYSKNKPIAYLYTTFLLFRNSLAALIKAPYKSKRMLYINGYFNVYFDALFNKLGKNSRYLPGKKY